MEIWIYIYMCVYAHSIILCQYFGNYKDIWNAIQYISDRVKLNKTKINFWCSRFYILMTCGLMQNGWIVDLGLA